MYLGIPTCQILGRKDRRSRWLQFTVELARLELWTIPNNWRTNCPQTSHYKKSSERQTNEINFHSHNSILSSLKIATQKVFSLMAPKKKAHDPTTQIGRLLKNAISVIIVGRKKKLRKATPLIKRQEKTFWILTFWEFIQFSYCLLVLLSHIYFLLGRRFWAILGIHLLIKQCIFKVD